MGYSCLMTAPATSLAAASVHRRLVERLREPHRYPHPVEQVELVSTHISTVLLAGPYAYKLKKPFDLGFLDFTTLEKRRLYCEEELRLNRRFAPELYLEVVPITGSADDPRVGGEGPIVDYAVKMIRFPAKSLLCDLVRAGRAVEAPLAGFAIALASLQDELPVAPSSGPFGSPEAVSAQARQNFEQLLPLLADPALARRVQALSDWTEAKLTALKPAFLLRLSQGRVREGHGDLHTGNLVLLDDRLVAFDCIEFNEAFRFIDVASEVAFLVMDLTRLKRTDLAYIFLNAWLGQGGDFDALSVLPFYLVFRAVVRAKVAAFAAAEPGADAQNRARHEEACATYLDLAERFAHPPRPAIVLMHGVSGSGKSVLSRTLAPRLPALWLRSDVERKRLFGLPALARTQSPVGGGIYGPEATRRTYARLAELALHAAGNGFSVILDATFARRADRQRIYDLAAAGGWPCVVLACEADPAILAARVRQRLAAARDPAEADTSVLARQLADREPPGSDEPVITVHTDTPVDPDLLALRLSTALS